MRVIYFNGMLRGRSACILPVRAGKGGDGGGNKDLCIMTGIDRYFNVDIWVYIMMVNLNRWWQSRYGL